MKKTLIILLIICSLIISCQEKEVVDEKNLYCEMEESFVCNGITVLGNQVFLDIKSKSQNELEVFEIKLYGAGTCGREMYNNEKFPFNVKYGEIGEIDVVCNNVQNLKRSESELILRYNDQVTGQLKTEYGTITYE